MKKEKKDTLTRVGAISLSVFATTLIVAGATYAYNNDSELKRGAGPGNFAAVEEALENNDYASWSELMNDRRMEDLINEENFSQFVEMHNLIKSGDFAAADEIRKSLGLPERGERGPKGDCDCSDGNRGPKHNWQNMEDAREALDNNDYTAWKEAVSDSPIADEVTEDNFSKLVESHNLMQSGDFEGAREIREELGLPVGRGMGKKLNR